MAEVLVLVDHLDGEIRKTSFELLTAARELGEPAAVVVGPAGAAAKLADRLREHGAEKIYVAETDSADFLTPEVSVLAALVEAAAPAAVLISASADGREIAGRLAVRTGSALLGDAVGVSRWRCPHRHALGVRRRLRRRGQGEHRAPGDHAAAGRGGDRRVAGAGVEEAVSRYPQPPGAARR